MTAFQRDLLATIARLERAIGLEIKDELDEFYTDVPHGRLYPNLDTLVEGGLVEKTPKDERSYHYTLTAPGRTALLADLAFREDAAGFFQASLDDVGDDGVVVDVGPELEAALERVVEAGLAVPICRGTKKDGSPCGRRVKAGGFCHLHADQAEAAEEVAA